MRPELPGATASRRAQGCPPASCRSIVGYPIVFSLASHAASIPKLCLPSSPNAERAPLLTHIVYGYLASCRECRRGPGGQGATTALAILQILLLIVVSGAAPQKSHRQSCAPRAGAQHIRLTSQLAVVGLRGPDPAHARLSRATAHRAAARRGASGRWRSQHLPGHGDRLLTEGMGASRPSGLLGAEGISPRPAHLRHVAGGGDPAASRGPLSS